MDDLGVPLFLETPIYHFYTTYSPCLLGGYIVQKNLLREPFQQPLIDG